MCIRDSLQTALDLRDVRVADPRDLRQLAQRKLGRLALLSQVLAQVADGDRSELRHDSIMLTPVSKMQAPASRRTPWSRFEPTVNRQASTRVRRCAVP